VKEKKLCYEVNEYHVEHSLTRATYYKLDAYRADVEEGIARVKKRPYSSVEVVLASSLCWSAEEAFKLHVAEAQLRLEKAEEALDDAKKSLAKALRAEAQWRETGKKVDVDG
jgi:hypothetical protein